MTLTGINDLNPSRSVHKIWGEKKDTLLTTPVAAIRPNVAGLPLNSLWGVAIRTPDGPNWGRVGQHYRVKRICSVKVNTGAPFGETICS